MRARAHTRTWMICTPIFWSKFVILSLTASRTLDACSSAAPPPAAATQCAAVPCSATMHFQPHPHHARPPRCATWPTPALVAYTLHSLALLHPLCLPLTRHDALLHSRLGRVQGIRHAVLLLAHLQEPPCAARLRQPGGALGGAHCTTHARTLHLATGPAQATTTHARTSTSLPPPIFSTATPPDSLASRSCSFSLRGTQAQAAAQQWPGDARAVRSGPATPANPLTGRSPTLWWRWPP